MVTLKDKIQHEILNILTIINLYMSEHPLSKDEKKHIQELTDILSILIAHQDILLGRKTQFVYQSIEILELLQIAVSKANVNGKNSHITYPQCNIVLDLDRYYMTEAIKGILKVLLTYVSDITFDYNEKKYILSILFDANENIGFLFRKNINQFFEQKRLHHGELYYQVALRILETYGSEVSIEENNTYGKTSISFSLSPFSLQQ